MFCRSQADPAVEPSDVRAPARTWGDRLAPLIANKLAVVGGVIATLLPGRRVHRFGASWWFRAGTISTSTSGCAQTLVRPLTGGFLLGTDNLGRSMAWRIAAGTAVSLFAGVVVTVLSMTFGMIMGAVAGYAGGVVDRLISGADRPRLGVSGRPGCRDLRWHARTRADGRHPRRQRRQLGRICPDRPRASAFLKGAGVCRGGPRPRRTGLEDRRPSPGPQHARHRAGDGRRTTSPSR